MKEIQLTQGKVAFVDDLDFESVIKFKWSARFDGVNWYALRSLGERTLFLHQAVMGGFGSRIDHRNGDGLDNQRRNLRWASQKENCQNRRKTKQKRSSVFKGVSWHKGIQKWTAQIKKDGRLRALGVFTVEEDAARAYDAAATNFFGDFACFNFPKTVGGRSCRV